MLIAHAVEKQRPAYIHLHPHTKAPTPGGQRQALRAATAMAGGHEHGGRFTPDLQFFAACGDALRHQRAHGHQQAGGATGEVGGLRVIRYTLHARVLVLDDAFFQAQGGSVVFVVIVDQRKAPVAVAFIQGEGAGVVAAHFEAQVRTVVLHRAGLDATQQLLAQAEAARVFGDGNRVQPCQGRAAMEQHQRIPEQLAVLFSHQATRHGRG